MTKLNFLLPLFFMMSITITQAQFGLKLGANLSASGSYGNTEEGESADLKLGYQGGVFYQLGITEKFNLMVELNYEAKGTISKKDYTINLPVQDPATGAVLGIGDYVISQEANSVHSYINIPILAVFGDGNLKYYIGPNIGFLASGKADFDRTINIALAGNPVGKVETNLEDVDWTDYESFKNIFTNPPTEDGNFLNSLEFGINIGAMYYVTESLFVDLRVSQGLSDATNNHYDNSIYPAADFSFPSREDTDRNLSIQLGLGYSF